MRLMIPEGGNGKGMEMGAEGKGWTPGLKLTPRHLTAACRGDPWPSYDRRAQAYPIYLGLLLYFCPS